MTLTDLKYLIALDQEKHFRKAAERCYVSQPTLSIAIKKMEEELEVQLFERNKSDIITTQIGSKIIALAQEILTKSNEIKQIAKENQNELSTEIRLGAIYTIAPYLLPKLIKEFHHLAPKVPLILQENYTHVLIEKLKQGELDLVILSLPYEDPSLEFLPLYDESFSVAMPKEHKLTQFKQISLKQIENETLLLLGAGHCFRDQVVDAFPNLDHVHFNQAGLQKTLEGSSLETIRYMVASGAGITLLPCTSINAYDEELFTVRPIEFPTPKRTVALVWRQSFARKQIIEIFKQSLSLIEIPCTIKHPLI